MPSKLELLLEKIKPSRTIEPNFAQADEAVAGFSWNKSTVDTWQEYEYCLAEFLKYLYESEFPTSVIEFNSDYGCRLAIRHLEKDYPGETSQIVFNIMNTGAEGGVYTIFKTLAQAVASEFSKSMIGSHVSEFWDNLSIDEQLAVSDEYIDLYKEILPDSVIHNRVRFKAKFWKVLENHPWMIRRSQSI